MMKASTVLVYYKVSPTAEYNHTENAPGAVLNKMCAWEKADQSRSLFPDSFLFIYSFLYGKIIKVYR